jgi:hypothetical protein
MHIYSVKHRLLIKIMPMASKVRRGWQLSYTDDSFNLYSGSFNFDNLLLLFLLYLFSKFPRWNPRETIYRSLEMTDEVSK